MTYFSLHAAFFPCSSCCRFASVNMCAVTVQYAWFGFLQLLGKFCPYRLIKVKIPADSSFSLMFGLRSFEFISTEHSLVVKYIHMVNKLTQR